MHRNLRAAAAIAASACLFAALDPAPAAARWRVVGPGIAVAGAEAGRPSLAVECDDGLRLAAYGLGRPGKDGAVTLSVDEASYRLVASGDAIRMALTEPDAAELSEELRRRLAEGRRVRLEGAGLGALPAEQRTFSLAGSREALEAVAAACR